MGGGLEQMRAFESFLLSKNHSVDLMCFPGNDYKSRIWWYYQMAQSRIKGTYRNLMVWIADIVERKIKTGTYDVVIGIGSLFSYVFTRDLSCLKLFSAQTSGADELYFSKKFNMDRIRTMREMEIEIMIKSDYVIFPWETLENYVKKYVWNGDNFVTVKYGCYPQKKVTSHFFPPSIVSIGNLSHNWANKELMSNLARTCPYIIDVYGRFKPEKKYNLNYKGIAPSLDVLYNYQFGLNTVSSEILRRNDHSSRIMPYLAYGLPVLSPDWMKFSNGLKGCLPYNEDNFTDLVDKYSDKDSWERLSQEAYKQAIDLDWNKTLEVLETLISKKV